jgi:hypothetical protein
MAAHRPEMPAPMITTPACVWSTLPTGTWGQNRLPPMVIKLTSFGRQFELDGLSKDLERGYGKRRDQKQRP